MHSRTTSIINWSKNPSLNSLMLEPFAEKRQKLDNNEAAHRTWWGQVGTRARHRTVSGQFEGKRAVVSHIVNALVRACLVAILVAIPALLVPHVASDTAQIVVVVALLSAMLTFMEYYGRYPSIIEFRFAEPYNRLRFIAVAASVISLSLIARSQTDPGAIGLTLTAIGDRLGSMLDFPFSPVRLMVLMLPADADAALMSNVRIAAGLSYTISLGMVAVFMVLVWRLGWPMRRGSFNVWINLPLFDPTRGGDVVERLRRDAGVNIVLGILLPFIIPTAVKAASSMIDPTALTNPQTLIWMLSAWAFLPASMTVRGIALLRVAELIEAKRRRVHAQEEAGGLQGV